MGEAGESIFNACEKPHKGCRVARVVCTKEAEGSGLSCEVTPGDEARLVVVVTGPVGRVGCDVKGKATWVSCTSPGEREDCCKKAGGAPNGNWCPPNCSLVGNDCKC
jgi:hypothetical protein